MTGPAGDHKPFTTFFRGEHIELPSTIEDIRAALPPVRREEFEEALKLFLGHWALETRPDIRDADDATFKRLESGDFSGFTTADPEPLMMYMTGGPVPMPSTIQEVREALPAEKRDAFTEAMEGAPAGELTTLLMRWVLAIPTEHDADEDALARRIAAGDFSEVTFADELGDDEYRSAG
ncbi:hypothetical protein ACFVIM_03945 [Streptomyces sp. NPDC057638]|uniref:hypothetical protein n=1 Tax=Streptomyces sp. NPDC057638 TaxID=3346190 RepID=UPI00367FB865